MKALVLEKAKQLSIRDMAVYQTMGENDVRIALKTVGVCGSDLHYYIHGGIGPFIVKEPMILGHEASGQVVEVGKNIGHLKVGDRVCMEPGIPDPASQTSRLGLYNIDPRVRFWATPPIHGCLCETVVHPANFTYKLPDNVSYAEGAMVEPLAIGLHAATKAKVRPGDVALVTGAGTIGLVSALSALSAGCAKVIISDVKEGKLSIAGKYRGIVPVNVAKENLLDVVTKETGGFGVDICFESSGSTRVADGIIAATGPGGKIILIGIPQEHFPLDIGSAQAKELSFHTIFRYAHIFPKAIRLISSGSIDLKSLMTNQFSFENSVKAFEFGATQPDSTVKILINMS